MKVICTQIGELTIDNKVYCGSWLWLGQEYTVINRIKNKEGIDCFVLEGLTHPKLCKRFIYSYVLEGMTMRQIEECFFEEIPYD